MDAVERVLHRSPALTLGEFVCPPQSSRWHDVNAVSGAVHVVFPRRRVVIRRRRGSGLADLNCVVFYRAHEEYERELRDPAGDHCFFVEIDAALADELPGGARATFAPSGAPAFAALQRALLAVRAGAEPLAIETEVATAVLEASADPAQAAASPAHRALVDDVRDRLAQRLDEPLSLAELAAAVNASPFHVTRVFGRHAGLPPHAYRAQLRLRSAAQRLLDGERDLSALAHDLGYSSHSHFTAAFRSAFGRPPSRMR